LLILLLAGAYACGRDATAPAASMREAATPAANHRGGHQPNGGQAAYVRCEAHPAYTGSADIGPRGGRVTAGTVTLYVPPGALSRTVHITATVPAGGNAYVEFAPSGLRFRRPAGLLFHAEDCDVPADPDVLYVNDDGLVLERIDARYIAYLQLVAAPIEHFSGYVLAW
jgi:hypothetical protein